MKKFSLWEHILLAIEFRVYSTLYRYVYAWNGKMDFASHEEEVMDEEINVQHEEMSDQEMSDECSWSIK